MPSSFVVYDLYKDTKRAFITVFFTQEIICVIGVHGVEVLLSPDIFVLFVLPLL